MTKLKIKIKYQMNENSMSARYYQRKLGIWRENPDLKYYQRVKERDEALSKNMRELSLNKLEAEFSLIKI